MPPIPNLLFSLFSFFFFLNFSSDLLYFFIPVFPTGFSFKTDDYTQGCLLLEEAGHRAAVVRSYDRK